jgi:ankyrin repeat protein
MHLRIHILLLALLLAFPAVADEAAQTAFLKAVASVDLTTVESMLEKDPALVRAHRPNGMSAVTVALFAIPPGGQGFQDAAQNEVLQALLEQKPALDVFDTAALGTAQQLEAMLRKEPSLLTKRNPFGWTLLHLASFAGNAANTELLIRKGAAIESRAESKFRNTPLQTALLSGQYATAKILIDRGADVLVRQTRGNTPMHEAAFLGRIDLVQLLLDHGAELNSVSDNGQTPLAEAVRRNHPEAVEWMKAKGAVIGIQPDEDAPKK